MLRSSFCLQEVLGSVSRFYIVWLLSAWRLLQRLTAHSLGEGSVYGFLLRSQPGVCLLMGAFTHAEDIGRSVMGSISGSPGGSDQQVWLSLVSAYKQDPSSHQFWETAYLEETCFKRCESPQKRLICLCPCVPRWRCLGKPPSFKTISQVMPSAFYYSPFRQACGRGIIYFFAL